jgi:hypothetical protein
VTGECAGGPNVRRRLVVAVALSALVTPAGADLADERELAEKYAPIVRLVEQQDTCGYGEPFVALVTAYVYFDARTQEELEPYERVSELPAEIQLTTTG